MLFVREISKRFGSVHAVRGVTFTLQPGEVVGLLGPNGAGKSTTIRTIAGLVSPDSGGVSIDGVDALARPRAAKARLGYLPEAAPFHPEMTARGYLMYRSTLAGLPRRERSRTVDGAMERCRIRDVARRRLGALSKGYRQRVGLAAALLHEPPVLILDEPTDGLDPSQVQLTRSLVSDSAQGRATLLSSHVLTEVEQVCSRVLIIAAGRLLADGTPNELIDRHGGSPTLTAEAKGTSADLRRRLASVRGLLAVSGPADETDHAAGWVKLTARIDPSAPDPRSGVAEALAGCMVRELSIAKPSLESVFSTIVQSGAQAEPPLAEEAR